MAGPKVEVSIPIEPAPEAATCVAAFEFKNFWRAITSAPVAPTVRLRVQAVQDAPLVVVVTVVPVVA